MKTTTERVFQIFKELNQIPRPSHHEERVADYLCRFAERLNLPYKRDKENHYHRILEALQYFLPQRVWRYLRQAV